MPSTPTTKSQVQAYKFVLRRMESALVRRDAAMLHEPMRAHMRATSVGVILAGVLCLGFVLASVLNSAGNVGEKGIVISKTGAIFVIGQNPKRLIPVPNIASARLLEMSAQSGGGDDPSTPPTMVDDSALRSLPHDVLYGMPNAPALLPDPANQVDANWAVCDQATVRGDVTDAVSKATVETTVLAGVPKVGQQVDARKTLAVQASDGANYLVYTAANPSGLGPNSVVRAKINPQASMISETFHSTEQSKIRKISVGLLNAIPEVKEMKTPTVPGTVGSAPQGYSIGNLTVGQVFTTTITSTNYYVVLPKGIQQVPPVVAKMLRITNGHGLIPSVQPSDINGVNQALLDADKLDLSTFPPGDVDPPIGFGDDKVSCLTWQYTQADHKVHTAFTVAPDNVPAPSGGVNTRLVSADGPGDRLDYFYMPGGKAAVVRSVTSPESIAEDGTITGPLYLVSDTGVKYGLPNPAVAQGLGLGANYRPAPEAIMKLLPTGANLDPQQATRVFDTVPILQDGQVHRQVNPSQGQQPGSGASQNSNNTSGGN